uniref:Ovule protein n=1 Tax=Haemonchus placei TaxID=6290 RepID=A0A0N4WLC7_HAEPC
LESVSSFSGGTWSARKRLHRSLCLIISSKSIEANCTHVTLFFNSDPNCRKRICKSKCS